MGLTLSAELFALSRRSMHSRGVYTHTTELIDEGSYYISLGYECSFSP